MHPLQGAGASSAGTSESRGPARRPLVIRYDNETPQDQSCPPGEPNYTLNDMAADGPAVLDAYGIEKAHIIGASMGGMITQVIGLNHPERVLTLTPIMSTPNGGAVLDSMEGKEATLSPPTPEVIETIMEGAALDWTDREALLANRVKMFKVLSGSAYPFDPAREQIFAAEIDRAISFASTTNHGPAIAQSEPWHERLGDLDFPTLVIHGTDDPSALRTMDRRSRK